MVKYPLRVRVARVRFPAKPLFSSMTPGTHNNTHSDFIHVLKWFHWGLNPGPSACKADVITNYTMKPLNIRPQKGKIIVGEKKKKKEGREERKGRIRKGKKERE